LPAPEEIAVVSSFLRVGRDMKAEGEVREKKEIYITMGRTVDH